MFTPFLDIGMEQLCHPPFGSLLKIVVLPLQNISHLNVIFPQKNLSEHIPLPCFLSEQKCQKYIQHQLPSVSDNVLNKPFINEVMLREQNKTYLKNAASPQS